jgi:excisionase family DNA binding protein
MSEAARDPFSEFARSLPAALDESALHELAARLQPFLTEPAQPVTPAERLYTTAETARHVGVNVETVRRAIRSGELRVAARIGRSPRLSREAIDSWLARTIEMTEAGPRRRPHRRQSSVLHEHSLRAAFKAKG